MPGTSILLETEYTAQRTKILQAQGAIFLDTDYIAQGTILFLTRYCDQRCPIIFAFKAYSQRYVAFKAHYYNVAILPSKYSVSESKSH